MTSAEGRGPSATAVGEATEAAATEAGSAEGSVEEVMEAAATVVGMGRFFLRVFGRPLRYAPIPDSTRIHQNTVNYYKIKGVTR